MSEKKYDLEDRTFEFAKAIRILMHGLKYNPIFENDIKQVIRSSGSIGVNDKLSENDFNYRIKICKKEAKETIYWLKLLELHPNLNTSKREKLIQEATEIMLILAAILRNRKLNYTKI